VFDILFIRAEIVNELINMIWWSDLLQWSHKVCRAAIWTRGS